MKSYPVRGGYSHGGGAAGSSYPPEISEELLNSTYGKKPCAKH